MKRDKLPIKISFLLIFIFAFFMKDSISQESLTIKKIIIEDNETGGRLLSPPTESKQEKIKLIPPKSILKKESNKKLIEDKEKAEDLKKKEIEKKLKAE